MVTSKGNKDQIRKVEHKKGQIGLKMCGRTTVNVQTFWNKIKNMRYTTYDTNINLYCAADKISLDIQYVAFMSAVAP